LTELGYIGRQYCTAFNMQPRSFLKQDNALPICGRCVLSSSSSSSCSSAHSEAHVKRRLGRWWLCLRRLHHTACHAKLTLDSATVSVCG
jgi:hypothetical protein